MSANFGSVLILIFAFVAATVMVLGSAWIRSRNKRAEIAHLAAGESEQMKALRLENEGLRGRLARQEERVAVLERIATDPAERTAAQIEALR